MQILKQFLVACVLAAVLPMHLLAEDTEAQALARAAMQQKLHELQGAAPAPAPQPDTPPVISQIPPITPVQVQPPQETPANQSANFITPPTSTSDQIEQARAALRAKMAELQAERGNSAPAEFKPARAAVSEKSTPPKKPVTKPIITDTKPAGPTKAEIRAAKEREAAAKREAQKQAAAEKVSPPAPAPFTPLEAPAPALPAAKEQRLQELLDQYRADKITSEEYHTQRAKIIAEP